MKSLLAVLLAFGLVAISPTSAVLSATTKLMKKMSSKGQWVKCKSAKAQKALKPGPVLLRKNKDGWFDCWIPAKK